MPSLTSRGAFAALFVACFAFPAIGEIASNEVTLRVEPLKTTVKEGEEIEVTVVFVGGVQEKTLILPMGADPSGIISYRATEIGSGRDWMGSRRDSRSFAADDRRRLAAGARLQWHHDALRFEGVDNALAGNLPAGTYRIVAIYDEARTFRPENRGSRMIRSEPVEIVVTAR